MSLGGEVLDQCSSLRVLAVPKVHKLKLSWRRKPRLLAQPDDLTIHPTGLALQAVVEPVDLNLKANSSEDSCRFLGPEDQRGGDKVDKKVSSVQKINSRKGRGTHV